MPTLTLCPCCGDEVDSIDFLLGDVCSSCEDERDDAQADYFEKWRSLDDEY